MTLVRQITAVFSVAVLLLVFCTYCFTVHAANEEISIQLLPVDSKETNLHFVPVEPEWDGLGVLHGPAGEVVWHWNIEEERDYHIHVLYASGQPRPCEFVLKKVGEKEIVKEDVLGERTGGFYARHLRWSKIDTFPLTSGKYSLTISAQHYMPHLRGILITTNPTPPTGDIFLPEIEKRKARESRDWGAYEKDAVDTRRRLKELLPDVSSILFIKRATFQSSHYYTDFIDGSCFFGTELCLLSLDDGTVKSLVPELREGLIGRCNLSYDGTKVIFDYKRRLGEGYRIWEVGIDGTGLRQLTFPPDDEEQRIKTYNLAGTYTHYTSPGAYTHHTDDMHPSYLPAGGFIFASTRCEYGILCDGPDYLTASVLYRADQNGNNLEKLSNNSVSESCPTVMEDGRILYTRWEYVDNGSVTNKGLWAINPDGTASVEVYGANIAFPSVFNVARQIPGNPTQFVCIGAPHMPLGVGTVLSVDTRIDRRTVQGVRYVTPEVDQQHQSFWSKPEDKQPFVRLFEHETVLDRCIQEDKSRDGKGNTSTGPLFMDPFPIGEHHFLVSYNPSKPWKEIAGYGVYLIDDTGERFPLFRDSAVSAWCPIPVRTTALPGVPQAPRDTELAARNLARLIVTDVYVGMDGVERGTIKYLRVNEHVPRPWSARRRWEGDMFDQQHSVITKNTHLGLKVQHGIVPVEQDGSAHFVVPADKNIFLQALDENYREVQRERTFVNFRPGEIRSCVGCHEQSFETPRHLDRTIPLALRREFDVPGPQPGERSGSRAISYFEDVQPVLDRHCVQCHNHGKMDGGINLSGTLTELFNVSYETLMEAKSFPVIGENHPKAGNNHYMPPYSFGSHASRLIKLLDAGHYDVKMPIEDWIRLTTWVDSNGQYYGTYLGRKNLKYKDYPDFRPIPTFEETQMNYTATRQ